MNEQKLVEQEEEAADIFRLGDSIAIMELIRNLTRRASEIAAIERELADIENSISHAGDDVDEESGDDFSDG